MSTVRAVALVVLAVAVWPRPATGPRWEAGSRPVRRPGGSGALPRWWRIRGSRPGVGIGDEWVADLAEVVAVGLDAGLDLPRAVLAASCTPAVADRAPWLRPRVAAAVAGGRGVASCLEDPLQPRDGTPPRERPPAAGTGLEVLARAWRLSEEVGASASATTSAAAAVLRSRAAGRRRAATLVAGPRTSMWLLTALPVLGPVLGLLAGVGPGRLYESPLAQASALVGVLLAALGWLWAARLLHRAQRAGTVSGPSG